MLSLSDSDADSPIITPTGIHLSPLSTRLNPLVPDNSRFSTACQVVKTAGAPPQFVPFDHLVFNPLEADVKFGFVWA
jgi:hypothetical protein